MSLWLQIGFIIAVFVCFFLYVAVGMAVGESQANRFLAWVLGIAAIGGGVIYGWWARKKAP